jgi:hypothetical protein
LRLNRIMITPNSLGGSGSKDRANRRLPEGRERSVAGGVNAPTGGASKNRRANRN